MSVKGIAAETSTQLTGVVENAAQQIVESTIETTMETVDFDVGETIELDEAPIKADNAATDIDLSGLTPEQLNELVGSMTQEEYEQFISGMTDYYDKQIEYLEGLLANDSQTGYKELKVYVDNYLKLYYDGTLTDTNSKYYLDKLKEFGVTDFTSATAFQEQMNATVSQIEEAIKMTKNVRDSAKYDYMYFLKDYEDYEMNVNEISQETFDADSNVTEASDYIADANAIALDSSALNSGKKIYNYEAFHKKHPEVNPMEYMTMVPEGAIVFGISDYEKL